MVQVQSGGPSVALASLGKSANLYFCQAFTGPGGHPHDIAPVEHEIVCILPPLITHTF